VKANRFPFWVLFTIIFGLVGFAQSRFANVSISDGMLQIAFGVFLVVCFIFLLRYFLQFLGWLLFGARSK
jgi:hypothetical protein